MDRRDFMKTGLAAGVAIPSGAFTSEDAGTEQAESSKNSKFRLKYAPHFGMFRNHAGDDPIEQLKFMADEGFSAVEDNEMMERSKDMQEKIANRMSRLGLTMGVFVGYAHWGRKTFVRPAKSVGKKLAKQIEDAAEVAKRVNAKWFTVLLDEYDNNLEWDYQTANAIDNLKVCAEVCEPSGLVMVLEPLNPWRDHPGLFLTRIPQAYQICRAVGSPSCKILNDLYHQQITEGNLIPNIDMAWDEIGYFQVGDNPGRCEPTTGEINYRNIFKHIYEKGYKGVIGMEHGNSKEGKEGERAVIEAYRKCDNF
ncbi:MAG TPA: TIM barrel protein [Planctomycetes bacterium]|nr:TIM barrel protein [Planctomycetota bacterium]